ncbi:MAG: WD40/YVTN/BNR-like repeat-containing protein, partial [Planctomycetota bacterium]
MRIALVVVSLLWIPAHVLAGGAVRAMTGAGRARWAVGDGGLVLCSEDAGASWREVAVPADGDFTAVAFEDDKTGHIFGGRCVPGHPGGATVGLILQTRDAGRTWKALPAGPLAHLHGGWTRGLRSVVFGRPTPRQPTGLWATVTGGRIWIPLRVRGTGALLGGDALGVNNACLVGPGHRIVHLHRLDELTTGEAPMAADAALTAVAFAGVRSIWAAGENGSALRYSGPSAGWQALSLPLPVGTRRLADLEAVAAWGDREAIFAGGLAGAIFHTTDAGKTFRRLTAPRPGPIHALHRDEDGTLLAGADGGRIFRSTDAGKNWQLVHGAESVDVLFISAPGDISSGPALAAHAASGLSVAALQAALPATRDGL